MPCIRESSPIWRHAWNRRQGVAFLTLAAILLTLLIGGCGGTAGMTAYRHGDYNEALREFKSEEDPEGNFAVGVMHYKGEGGARDPDEAVAWFRRAAGQGYVEAQVYLGVMYARGDGVEKDLDEAAVWLRKAADQGSLRAKEYLKRLSANGSAGL